jgi:hypothetical protein
VHFRRVAAALGRCVCVVVCVSTPVMRAAVCLLYVSAVKHRRVAVLRVHPSRHPLAVCSCCVVVVVAAAVVVCRAIVARAWYRCGRVVTCASVAVSLAGVVG